MAKYISNKIVNLHDNLFTSQQSSFLIAKKVFLVFIFTLFCNSVVAQHRQNHQKANFQMKETKAFLRDQKSNNYTSRAGKSKSKNVENLLLDIQPSIYIKEGIAKTYGDNPTNLFVDIKSLDKINNSKLSVTDVEIISITIVTNNDLNSEIDLSKFSKFPNLKYIHLISKIKASEEEITNMISYYDAKYTLFYEIQEESSND